MYLRESKGFPNVLSVLSRRVICIDKPDGSQKGHPSDLNNQRNSYMKDQHGRLELSKKKTVNIHCCTYTLALILTIF